ncbi:MAG: hypothetical protein Q9219_006655 [cf. Caloplaca sp. 3 TL-2023]
MTISMTTTISPRKGIIKLLLYVPPRYHLRKPGQFRPAVINFHGGGFTIGSATDDARFAHAVTSRTDAIFVSIDYRLAPENPFPTAVEDGVDAILYLLQNADRLGIDPHQLVMNGFSAGGNLAFSVLLRLNDLLHGPQATSIAGENCEAGDKVTCLQTPYTIRAIMAWYPSLDFTLPRAARKATNARQDKELPNILTNLFDASYVQDYDKDKQNPYLSPAAAPDAMLEGLPETIILFPCQWDGLAAEAGRFRERLEQGAGKRVIYRVIPEARHGFDRAPNPFYSARKRQEYYQRACMELKSIFANALEPKPAIIKKP